MLKVKFEHVDRSSTFKWPWTSPHGVLVVCGGSGGGGGVLCIEGLNLYGATGGGGKGGDITSVYRGDEMFTASGGDGGDGGNGGAVVSPTDGKVVSNGGKGYLGETKINELTDLTIGEQFEIKVGKGGEGGRRGEGYEPGTPR